MESNGQAAPSIGASSIGATTADIINCWACQGSHDHVACAPYKKPNPPFTHWFMCPTAQEPVGVGIAMCDNKPLEIHHRALMDISAAQGKPFRVAIFSLNGERVECVQHSSSFPNEKTFACVEGLAKALDKIAPPAAPSGPLPRASQERLALFGRPIQAFDVKLETPPQFDQPEPGNSDSDKQTDSDGQD